MVKVHTFGEKGSGKGKSMKGNGRMGNNMVKGQIFLLMASMLGNTRMGFGMVKVHTLGLMGIKG